MQTITFWLIYPIVLGISKLPWKLFYVLSDIICFFVYRVFGYRKKTVTDNLVNAFPEKSITEIRTIRTKFYSHMCDMFLEMIRSVSISNEENKERFKLIENEDFKTLEAANKSYILLAGHHANFEWSNIIELNTQYICVGIYKKIRNPHFNKLVKKIRMRFGSEVIENRKIMRYAIEMEQKDPNKRLYGIAADQTPKKNHNNVIMPFMGRKVPVFVGVEVLAKKTDMNIAFLKIKKVKRGFYEFEVKLISDNVKNVPNFKATETYIKMLEDQIKEAPEYYLWTHKRWKHAV